MEGFWTIVYLMLYILLEVEPVFYLKSVWLCVGVPDISIFYKLSEFDFLSLFLQNGIPNQELIDQLSFFRLARAKFLHSLKPRSSLLMLTNDGNGSP